MSPLRPMTSTAKFLRCGEDFLAGDHDAEVDHLVIIAGENDADDVLADVVHVALDGGEQHLALRLLVAGALLFLLHEGQEPGDRLLHHAGAFHDLRRNILPSPKRSPTTLMPFISGPSMTPGARHTYGAPPRYRRR